MNNQPIIASRAPAPRDEADLEEIKSVIFSNEDLSGNSSLLDNYKKLLCEYFQLKYAIPVSSGTAAIHCALMSLDIMPNDEVIVPITAALMSAIPILSIGAKPIFVDCQKETFGIDINSLKDKISSRTKCIISVPMWGYPTFEDEVYEYASSLNIPIIEDAAQAIGSVSSGKLIGTRAVIGCFSTHELKLISTGEGGFILTNDRQIADRCNSFSKLGFNSTDKIQVTVIIWG